MGPPGIPGTKGQAGFPVGQLVSNLSSFSHLFLTSCSPPWQGPVGLDGAPGLAGSAGLKGQKGESGAVGEGYQFLSKEEVS